MTNIFEKLQTDPDFALFFLGYYTLLPLLAQILIVLFFRKKVSMQRWMFAVPVFLIGQAYLSNLMIGLMMVDQNGEYAVRSAGEALGMTLFSVSFIAMVLMAIISRIFYGMQGKEYVRGLLIYLAALAVLAGALIIFQL
ncbi:hypothetical protein EV586_10580 [Tumebacillus sp. BK434]|uniref:hypothetical protein n=1 Tax=Tumebacillus sp. BK434 TaxID=2512169 RepID=UPI001049AC48|nr:hypothetical protein [Tumebacillus sp. BK434]TCP53736.1 hypothetical protein EV586_10580 [Tumebacillus sp. BK434]